MSIAFYAPLKPPNHETPSGDRTIARAILKALRFTGAHITVASSLRSRDGKGDKQVQSQMMAAARAENNDLISQGQSAGWRAWITYHNYYKAPDLLGPYVSKALNIPYIQIESTRARKRLKGPWAEFAYQAEQAADAATLIFYFTQRDAFALKRDAPAGQRLRHLKPFLSLHELPPMTSGFGPMLSVGMMREGDKLASYEMIAETLAQLRIKDWHLNIAGDGIGRAEVETMLSPFKGRVSFLGALSSEKLQEMYRNASLLLWPGVNEAFGLTYLEAQAHGLPVIAQNRPGVREVLAPGDYPGCDTGASGLAIAVEDALSNPQENRANGIRARHYVEENHLLPAAASTLHRELSDLGVSI
ncbi:MAG: glycosyltransferase family 4 protein [Pseudomonadota bacterium]